MAQNTRIPMRVRCGFTFTVAADANIPIYVRITSGVLKGLSFKLRVRRGERTHFTIEPRDDVADTLLRNCPRFRQELVLALFVEDRRLSRAARGGCRVCRWGGHADLKWDDAAPSPEVLDTVLRAADYHIIWGVNYLPLPLARCLLVWDKGACFRNRQFAEAELAWTLLDRPVKIFTRDPLARKDYHRGRDHPTQKPVQLLDWCLSLLSAGCDTILDPFMGSGTTGVACVKAGKGFVGIEREVRYFEAACRRIAEALQRPSLLDVGRA